MKRNLLGVFIALLLNPVFGGPFAVMAFVSNEMTKTIERLIIMGNLKSARNKFKRVKVISRISYWGSLTVVLIPYIYFIIVLLIYQEARGLGVPFYYIHDRIVDCYLTLKSESCKY